MPQFDRYSDRHLCRHCGVKLGDHSGPGNPLCPEGRCPATRAWGVMTPWPRFTKMKDVSIDRFLKRFWTQKDTIFSPVH